MCAAISNWYTSRYGTWNRTRRLQVPPYVATENNVNRNQSRIATVDALILNMNEVDNIIGLSNRTGSNQIPSKKDDTLFGPGVGVISSGPSWADSVSTTRDEISPDVLKAWLEKSKDTSIPTTTLQALVNLKRPSIKLSPLIPAMESTEGTSHTQHGLEFEFDCDAPKCGIKMFVISQHGFIERMLVFESVVEGGFGRSLKYDEGAVLELANLESTNDDHNSAPVAQPQSSVLPIEAGNHNEGNSNVNGVNSLRDEANSQSNNRGRRRFSHFTFRKRIGNVQRQLAGPALPVVDADSVNPNISNGLETGDSASSDDLQKGKEESGIKVVIELEALDEEGLSLVSPNSQLTYLHIVRIGVASTEEDRRPWMVKVVKREAKIGNHLFHLHEIYGLSSAASNSQTTDHSYPPPMDQTNDEQTSECLLCLSSPREVVLLPCRHLVACRECAVNMVEFGAGGNLVHSEDNPAATGTAQSPATGDNMNVDGNNETGAGAVLPASVPHTAPSRRKRKAKGWFCPVCRQPYTSLLRITATPPEKDCLAHTAAEEMASTTAEVPPAPSEPISVSDTRSFFPRSNFLRSLSRAGSRPEIANSGSMV